MGWDWTGPLACLSLSSVMLWIQSDPSIWKPIFPNLVLPNKAQSSNRVKCLLDPRINCSSLLASQNCASFQLCCYFLSLVRLIRIVAYVCKFLQESTFLYTYLDILTLSSVSTKYENTFKNNTTYSISMNKYL